MGAIDVLGELSVLSDEGEQLQVGGQGNVVYVDLPNLSAGRSMASRVAGRAKRRELINRLHAGLRLADVTLQVQVRGRPVARLAPHSKTTWLSKLLGLGAVELKPVGLLLASLHRQARRR